MGQHLPSHKALLTYAVFPSLATVRALPSLDTCIICCLPVQNTHTQSTTILNTHATPQIAHTRL